MVATMVRIAAVIRMLNRVLADFSFLSASREKISGRLFAIRPQYTTEENSPRTFK